MRTCTTFHATTAFEKICINYKFSLVLGSMVVNSFIYNFFATYLCLGICVYRYIFSSYTKMSKYHIGEYVDIKRKTLENLDIDLK
jgi:hypothetical protein